MMHRVVSQRGGILIISRHREPLLNVWQFVVLYAARRRRTHMHVLMRCKKKKKGGWLFDQCEEVMRLVTNTECNQ